MSALASNIPPLSRGSRIARALPQQQMILIALILLEIAIFSAIGTNFFTWANFYEIPRLNVELGLLALALTPVIVTGGIDLSVGSLMGLGAVLFGKMWRDAHLSPWMAAILTVGIGGLAGWLNATLITRLRIPALIATLGTFSLFRGIAEGLTRGVDNFTNFPAKFLFLGQGYIGPVPTQVPIFVLAAIFFWALLHRMTTGRALSAIGFAPEGARYAGLPVDRKVSLTYILSGLAAGLAAVIYVARVGQAKADAGTGYELSAIAAVVLGGTSIFGGLGSIIGTLLGLFAIAILQDGLRLASLPPELSGILTGLLLLAAIGLDVRRKTFKRKTIIRAAGPVSAETLDMKNTQMAVLCAVILLAAFIIHAGDFMLVQHMKQDMAGGGGSGAISGSGGDASPRRDKPLTIAMMPKSKGNAYFIACRKGADQAAAELGATLLWDGPTDPDPARQNEIVDTWIVRGVDVLAVACENGPGVSTVLRKARQHGIKVVTFDADSDPDARDFFVNQATAQGIGYSLMDNAARVMNGKGKFAIITASLTAANMNEWRKYIEERRVQKYPDIPAPEVRPCDDLRDKAFEEANTILNKDPDVKLIMAICSPAVPGAAEAVKQKGRTDVKVIGLGLPNENKPYVKAGITDCVILWNTMDLGYLTVYAAELLKTGALQPGDTSLQAGHLRNIEIKGDNVLLGKPFVFTKDNIDQYDF